METDVIVYTFCTKRPNHPKSKSHTDLNMRKSVLLENIIFADQAIMRSQEQVMVLIGDRTAAEDAATSGLRFTAKSSDFSEIRAIRGSLEEAKCECRFVV